MVSARELDNRRREIKRIYGEDFVEYKDLRDEYSRLTNQIIEINRKNHEKKMKKFDDLDNPNSFFSKYEVAQYAMQFDEIIPGESLKELVSDKLDDDKIDDLFFDINFYLNNSVYPYWGYKKDIERIHKIDAKKVPTHPMSKNIDVVRKKLYEIISNYIDLKTIEDREKVDEFKEKLNKFLYNEKHGY